MNVGFNGTVPIFSRRTNVSLRIRNASNFFSYFIGHEELEEPIHVSVFRGEL